MARMLLFVTIGMLAFLVYSVSQIEIEPPEATPTAVSGESQSDAVSTSNAGVSQPTVVPPSGDPWPTSVQPAAQRSVTVAHGDILSPADGNCYVKVFEQSEPVTGFGTGLYLLVTVAGTEAEIQQRISEIQRGAAEHARSLGKAGCSIIG